MASDSGRRRATLTFDNGPTTGVTDMVLDVLAAKDVPAAFFVVGSRLRQPGGRDLVRRAYADGHLIGHHTATHTVLLGAAADPVAAVEEEIAGLAPELAEFDRSEKLYRPYAAGGVLDRRVFSTEAIAHLQDRGYTCVLWNSVPHDWDDPDGWVGRAVADVAAGDWTAVVLHDVASGAMAHLGAFIDQLRERGVEIVQEFPDSCVPMRNGEVRGSLAHLVPLSPVT